MKEQRNADRYTIMHNEIAYSSKARIQSTTHALTEMPLARGFTKQRGTCRQRSRTVLYDSGRADLRASFISL